MTRNELITVGHNGETDVLSFPYQPTTDSIAASCSAQHERFVLQRIGGEIEVYDLRTLRRHLGGWTIGLPVFAHTDEDAAIMWAILNLGGD